MELLYYSFHLSSVMAVFLAAVALMICIRFSQRRQIWVPVFLYFLYLGCSQLTFFIQTLSGGLQTEGWITVRFTFFMLSLAALTDFGGCVCGFTYLKRRLIFIAGGLVYALLFFLLPVQMVFAVFTAGAYLFGVISLWKLSTTGNYEEPVMIKLFALFLLMTGLSFFAEQCVTVYFFQTVLTRFQVLAAAVSAVSLVFSAFSIWSIIRRYYLNRMKIGKILLLLIVSGYGLFLTSAILFSRMAWHDGLAYEKKECHLSAERLQSNLEESYQHLKMISDFILQSGELPEILSGRKFAGNIVKSFPDHDTVLIYVLNQNGVCVECSGKAFREELPGANLSFRKYFQEAVRGPVCEVNTGLITKRSALYYAQKISGKKGAFSGVLVVQESLEKVFAHDESFYAAILDQAGVILISSGTLEKRVASIRQPIRNIPEMQGCFFETALPVMLADRTFFRVQFASVIVWLFLLAGFAAFLLQRVKCEKLSLQSRNDKNIFENTLSGLIITDENLSIININQQALSLLKYRREDLLQRNLGLLYPDKEEAQKVMEKVLTELQKKGCSAFELDFYTGTAKQIHLHLSGHSLSVKNSESFSAAAVWSITDETGNHAVLDRLALCEAKYHALINYLPEHFFITSTEGILLSSSNPLIERAIQSKNGTMLGDFFDEKTTEYYLELFTDIARTGIPVTVKHSLNFNGHKEIRIDTLFPICKGSTVTGIGCFSRNPDEFSGV